MMDDKAKLSKSFQMNSDFTKFTMNCANKEGLSR